MEFLKENDLISDIPSVCDIGCGAGIWLSIFKKNGFNVQGYDGNEYSQELQIENDEFAQVNLMEPLQEKNHYDIAISLEVAEHIPIKHCDTFLSSITDLADIIVFSAAVPFQMGQGHVNEQYQSYWVKKFDEKGYECLDVLRKQVWSCKDVCHYYKQNLFIMLRRKNEFQKIIEKYKGASEIVDVIHPETWEKVQSWLPVRAMVALYNNPFFYRLYQKYKYVKRKY